VVATQRPSEHTPIHPRSCENKLPGGHRRAPKPRTLIPLSGLRRHAAFLLSLGLFVPALAWAQRKDSPRKPAQVAKPRAIPADGERAAAAAEDDLEKQLALLARALRDLKSPAAYARLSGFAARQAKTEMGARAALALGYYDYNRNLLPQAQRWLDKAERDTILWEYTTYWHAQVNRRLGRNAEALRQLEALRREYPGSAMTEQVIQSLVEAALSIGMPERAAAAFDGYDKAALKPALLLLRAQVREKAHALGPAARDYLSLYYRSALSDEAKTAGERIPVLVRALGEEFPGVPTEQLLARATAFYEARKWREAGAEYERIMPQLSETDRQRAQVRAAACRVELEAAPEFLAALQAADPEVDAERLYLLSQAYRSQQQESEMLAAIEKAVERSPHSRWAEEAVFAAGNYFWVNLDRNRAASYYRRVLEQFPAGKYALATHWRLAWVAYLGRQPEAAERFEEHLRRFPGSQYAANALYWLGRAAERSGSVSRARSFYVTAQNRFPQTYFGRQAAERLRRMDSAPVNSADSVGLIVPPPPLPRLDDAVPPAAVARWTRAQALRSIAFDSSAELELRAGYAATGSVRLLLEAAKAQEAQGHYSESIATMRQVIPQAEARQFGEVPLAVWRTLYPLPDDASVRRFAGRHQVDPMLVAGVIRQESVFDPSAVSYAGAVGLMQILPKQGRILAQRLKLRFARGKLFDPEYNLQLGTLYLADLVRMMGSSEAALAAYNAGEDRVAAWKAERNFEEPPEFVESIPFTQTREYVQICWRNAEVYRFLYVQSPH